VQQLDPVLVRNASPHALDEADVQEVQLDIANRRGGLQGQISRQRSAALFADVWARQEGCGMLHQLQALGVGGQAGQQDARTRVTASAVAADAAWLQGESSQRAVPHFVPCCGRRAARRSHARHVHQRPPAVCGLILRDTGLLEVQAEHLLQRLQARDQGLGRRLPTLPDGLFVYRDRRRKERVSVPRARGHAG